MKEERIEQLEGPLASDDDQRSRGRATVQFPVLLPIFTLAAVAGIVCALALTVQLWRQAASHRDGANKVLPTA